MKEHEHRYKVLKESVFGLVHINAVMECVRVVDKKPCRERRVEMMPITAFERQGVKRISYFYPPKNMTRL